MKMSFLRILGVALVLLSQAQFSFAGGMGQEEALFADIPSVVVASKKSEDIVTAPGTVYVLTEKDIKNFGFRDLKEILNSLPNFDNYWQGAKVDGSARGFEGTLDQVTFLLNGREFGENRVQQAWITDHSLPAGKIKRVEIMMGPNSTLYGAHSMQGVINIVLKTEDEGQPNGGYVNYSYGAPGDHRMVEGLYRKNTPDTDIGMSFTYYTAQNNYKRYADFNADDNFSRQPAIDAIRDKNPRNFAISDKEPTVDLYTRVGKFYMGYSYWETQGQFGMDNPQFENFANQYNGTYNMPFLGWKSKIGDTMNAKVEFQYLSDLMRARFPTIQNNDVATATNTWHIADYEMQGSRATLTSQLDWNPGDRLDFVFGADGTRRKGAGLIGTEQFFPVAPPSFPRVEMDKTEVSGFTQAGLKLLDNLKLTYGLRAQKESFANGIHNLNHAALVYSPWEGSAFKAIFSQGFRAAGFIELSQAQNPTKPMRMNDYELVYSQKARLGSVELLNSASVYNQEETDRFGIGRTGTGGNDFFIKTFPGKYGTRGFEDMLKVSCEKLSGFVSYRYVNADPETFDFGGTGTDVITVSAVPITRLKLGLSYDFTEHYGASFWVDSFRRTQVPALRSDGSGLHEVFTVPPAAEVNVNLRAGGFKYGDNEVDFNIYVENALDKLYYDPYPSQGTRWAIVQPPRNVEAKLSMKF